VRKLALAFALFSYNLFAEPLVIDSSEGFFLERKDAYEKGRDKQNLQIQGKSGVIVDWFGYRGDQKNQDRIIGVLLEPASIKALEQSGLNFLMVIPDFDKHTDFKSFTNDGEIGAINQNSTDADIRHFLQLLRAANEGEKRLKQIIKLCAQFTARTFVRISFIRDSEMSFAQYESYRQVIQRLIDLSKENKAKNEVSTINVQFTEPTTSITRDRHGSTRTLNVSFENSSALPEEFNELVLAEIFQ
jgi:hypothetical protein